MNSATCSRQPALQAASPSYQHCRCQSHSSSGLAASSSVSINMPPSTNVRLLLEEIDQCRKEGRCFHSNELFTSSHKLQCKHIFIIEVVNGDEDDDSPARG
ncbi:hypothetical protein GUJ93_ZPchr0004g39579 [Zizania palustris]|uniref:Uncharacterized protein n=1 Tax=Zizania palustris TaxID=103762 RepID=A0A8J5VZP2_ZIZPA|nr:hypothetical protein GUJ93_ZPchr0004g39579 [Zizania palustris]